MRGWLRDHGLLITNVLLFVIFFGGMVLSGVRVYQSEFLAVAVIVGASVYLRQRGSAESKAVAEPHHETGA